MLKMRESSTTLKLFVRRARLAHWGSFPSKLPYVCACVPEGFAELSDPEALNLETHGGRTSSTQPWQPRFRERLRGRARALGTITEVRRSRAAIGREGGAACALRQASSPRFRLHDHEMKAPIFALPEREEHFHE